MITTVGRLPPNTERVAAGALTWLSFVLAPWLGPGAAFLFGLIALLLMLCGFGAMVFYVVLSTREVRGFGRAGGALLLLTALVTIGCTAVLTGDREARETLAASRGLSTDVNERGSAPLVAWAVGGDLLFLAGMIVSGRRRHLAWTVAETGAFWLVYPTVIFLVRLDVVPVSA